VGYSGWQYTGGINAWMWDSGRDNISRESTTYVQSTGGGTMTREFKLPGGEGLACEQCRTPLHKVYRTTRSAGFVMRERICPQCGAIHTTSERVLAVRNKLSNFSDQRE